jgi:hypothetical protein
MLLRWLIIGTLIGYVLYKMGFFKALSGGYNEPSNQNRRPDSKVNVNTAPPKEKKRSSFKGGDYVDYEEIK